MLYEVITLKKLGINSLTRPADHYGLSLILGGAEMSLWDICGMYASMARILDHYYPYDGVYDEKDVHPPTYTYHDEKEHEKLSIIPHPPLSAAAIYIVITSYSIHYTKLYEYSQPVSLEGLFTSNKDWKEI